MEPLTLMSCCHTCLSATLVTAWSRDEPNTERTKASFGKLTAALFPNARKYKAEGGRRWEPGGQSDC